MSHLVKMELGGRELSLESGKLAKQADGTVLIRYQDTILLVAAVGARTADEGKDFFPLQVDYREKGYAAGRIPGNVFRREGRPSTKEILSARLTDRPIRPLFPKGFLNEVQVYIMVLSSDGENDPGFMSIVGASAALTISDLPFDGPIASVRLGRIGDEFILNPTYEQMEKSILDLTVAGTKENVIMIEAGSEGLSEEIMLEAISTAHRYIIEIVGLQEELARLCGKPKREIKLKEHDPEIEAKVRELATAKMKEALGTFEKLEREHQVDEVVNSTMEQFADASEEEQSEAKHGLELLERDIVRLEILDKGVRTDGRGLKDIRPITCEIGILPRTHGSALFTRGETQALVITTLGTAGDEQRIFDDLGGDKKTKEFILHYNFPNFSVGETGRIMGPGRREVGHGALAEKALESQVVQDFETFPYVIRIVSEILESNGSSSMASVCGGSLSMMDAGVPMKSSVAGIAMGLIKEGDRFAVLSDILGLEDHLGDIDFKVAGTREGITALQLDCKIEGFTFEVMRQAFEQAREGRLFILDEMEQALAKPRDTISDYAPRVTTTRIHQDKIRDVIGPGGKVIRSIEEQTGADVNVEDDGKITVSSPDMESVEKAMNMIENLTEDVEVGKTYNGKVVRIMDFGAFMEVLPGKEGLLHISQMDNQHVRQVRDILNEGDMLEVKVTEIDDLGRVNLSRKVLMPQVEGEEHGDGERERGRSEGDRDRGRSGGDRNRGGSGDRSRPSGNRDRGGSGDRSRPSGNRDRGGSGDRNRGGSGDRSRPSGDRDRGGSGDRSRDRN